MIVNMKSPFVLIVFLLLATACSLPKAGVNNLSIKSKNKNLEHKFYKISKIDSLNSVYLIYAKRSDSTFMIVSPKLAQNLCKNIKIRGKFNFKLHSQFEARMLDNTPFNSPQSNRLLITHYHYYGTDVPVSKAPRGFIYIADSVIGLCFKSIAQ